MIPPTFAEFHARIVAHAARIREHKPRRGPKPGVTPARFLARRAARELPEEEVDLVEAFDDED